MNLLNCYRYNRDLFFSSKKNKTSIKNSLYVLLFIIVALLISLVLIQILGYDAGVSFKQLFENSFLSESSIKSLFTNFSILMLSGLAFIVGYKSGIFNIGISGQMMASGMVILSVASVLTKWETDVSGSIIAQGSFTGKSGIIIVLLAAMATGSVVSMVSGLLKIYFKIHEVVSCILLNWIIFFVVKFLLLDSNSFFYANDMYSREIYSDFTLYDNNFESAVIPAIIICLVVTAIVWFVFKFTSLGKKMQCVGQSTHASLYSGYNVKMIQLGSFAWSGAISGLLAMLVYTSSRSSSIPISPVDIIPAEGFNGIAVALIAFSNPLALIPIVFIVSMFYYASLVSYFPSSLGGLIMALVMYGVAISTIMYRFHPILRFKKLVREKNWFTKCDYFYKDEEYENKRKILIRKKIDEVKMKIVNKSISTSDLKNYNCFKKLLILKQYKRELYSSYCFWKKQVKCQYKFYKGEN